MKAATLVSLLVLSIIALSPFIHAEVASVPSQIKSSTAHPVSPFSSSQAPSHSFSSSSAASPASPVSSSAAVQPPTVAYPLNLTVPFSPAPASASIRLLDDTYYYVLNTTVGEVTLSGNSWSAASVVASMQTLMGDERQWKKQQKQLARHVRRVDRLYSTDTQSGCPPGVGPNATCAPGSPGSGSDSGSSGDEHRGGKHDKHHNKGNTLMNFWLRHTQCRACVQYNMNMLIASKWATTGLPYLASYQPAAVMKWCTLTTPVLASEQSPLVSAAPLADWEGVCIPAEVQCPSATVDMNILSPSACAVDDAATKQSCTLCVLDGYEWQTGQRAFNHADNYDGQCVDPTLPGSNTNHVIGSRQYQTVMSVTDLDSCPSVVASMETARQFNALAMSFAAFVAVTVLLLCCSCLRACCVARKQRQLALLRLTNGQSTVEPSASVSVSVPAVSSSPTPSAPPAAGYPAAMAAAQQYHEPLLNSGLNPPRMTVTSAYPQLQAQRVAVAEPYAYGRF